MLWTIRKLSRVDLLKLFDEQSADFPFAAKGRKSKLQQMEKEKMTGANQRDESKKNY